ncbi:hypothetical protein [Rothia sp. ZJ1223]|uniref:hypothetical protein n=1 Tax=Rothia sp. ZJ1223 TaxID=2811098 RepID=UPI00195CB5A9|nr:hypothetical protein [Rothia sp. ZJ1223]MBM7051747.1 hypothetical protein [Rothia sp. ZJ1223]
MAQDTGIKEVSYALAREFGWELEYNGGLELDGEFLDDADLSRTFRVGGRAHRYVLNLSFDDTTAYGYTLLEEPESPNPVPAAFGGELFLPASGTTIAEKYYFTSPEDMVAEARTALTALLKKVS